MSESGALIQLLRASIRPLAPKPTLGVDAVLPKLRGVRALVFDFYDTLILTERRAIPKGIDTAAILGADLMRQASRAGGSLPARASDLETTLLALIEEEHDRARREDSEIVQPEVNILHIFSAAAGVSGLSEAWGLEAAARWEAWTTPSTPTPQVKDALHDLRERGIALGIGSNAQAVSELLFAAHFGGSPAAIGFHPALTQWSWRVGRAKPDPEFFRALLASASAVGFAAGEILFVGNDPARDIEPAAAAGFATALYAGDARAMRPHLPGVKPDAVITCMSQLTGIAG